MSCMRGLFMILTGLAVLSGLSILLAMMTVLF
jgi:hypothetical protein